MSSKKKGKYKGHTSISSLVCEEKEVAREARNESKKLKLLSTFYFFFIFATILRWAINNLIDLKYSFGDMKVVELVIERSK